MDIMKSTPEQYLKISRACMERYSKSTHLKAVELLTSHEAVIEMEKIIDKNLPEQEFLKEIENFVK